MEKKYLVFPLLAGVVVAGLSSCKDKDGELEWEETGNYTLRESSSASPKTWNVHNWETNTDSLIMGYTEMGLYDFVYSNEGGTEHYEIIPEMAAAKPVAEELTEAEVALYGYKGTETRVKWKIALNEKATWADGTPINADTYLYSMQQMLRPDMKNYRASSYYSGSLALANAETYYKNGEKVFKPNGSEGSIDQKVYFSLYEPVVGLDEGDGNLSLYECCADYMSTYGPALFPKLKALFDNVAVYGSPSVPKAVEVTSANRAEIFAALKEFGDQFYNLNIVDSDDLGKTGWVEGECVAGAERSVANFFVVAVDEYNATFEEVGIKKTGEYEITLFLAKPITDFYLFYSLASNWIVYQPLYEAGMTLTGNLYSTNYGTSLSTYMSYGPYKLTAYQIDKSIVMERNLEWYGYHDGKHVGQFQTSKIDVQIVPTQATQLLMFEKGDLDSAALQGSDMKKYRTSSSLLYTPQSYTSKVTLNSSFNALKANQEALEADKKDGKSYNKTVMANVKFREALSWSLNRKDFATTMTAGSGVGLAPINNSYVADVDTGVKYRDTEAGKAVISSVYGNSTTGYDPDKAVELLNAAYDEELASKKEGSLVAGDVVSLRWEVYDDDWMDYINYYINDMKAVLAESKFGKNTDGVTFEITTAVTGESYADNITAGKCEFGMSTWGGAAMDPYGVLQVYDDPAYKYEYGFDGTKCLVDVVIGGEKVTKSFHDWYVALVDGEYVDAEFEVRVAILAACEEALIRTWNFITIYTRQSVSLLSYKVKYVTENYNELYGYGGIRFMTYNYTDEEWAERVKQPLDYAQ